MKKEKGLIDSIVKDFERLSSSRTIWENHWKEIAQFVLPVHKNRFVRGQFGNEGEKNTQEIYDSTAQIALKRFGAIMDSLLTPASSMWHRVGPSDPVLAKDREVREYFEESNRILMKQRYLSQANFSSQNYQKYLSLGAYGTGAMFTDKHQSGKGLRYKSIFLGEIYPKENHQGIIDTVYRLFEYTARQAVEKWGSMGLLPERILSAAKNSPDTKFEFIHYVGPNDDMDPERADHHGMPFCSYYISKEGRVLVEEGGYTSFPYQVTRYEQAPGELFGRSPAMDVLPAMKTLNEQKKTILKQGHRAVDPVLLAADDGILDSFSLKPGAINAGGVSADGRPLVTSLPVGSVQIGLEMMQQEQAVINDAFLISIFQILTERPQMTATEVVELAREKGILLAPTLGRIQTEYLGTLIDRELDILAAQGLLPPMPEVLLEAKGEYRVEYDAPITESQRARQTTGFMRSLDMALNVVNATQNPAIMDIFNFDVAMPEIADDQGVPVRWLASPEDIQAKRQGRAEAQQQQQDIQAAPAAAAMMKAQAAVQKSKG